MTTPATPMLAYAPLVAYARAPGRTVADLLAVVLPELTENERESVLWEETGFPHFWPTPDGTGCLVSQLLTARRLVVAGVPREALESVQSRGARGAGES